MEYKRPMTEQEQQKLRDLAHKYAEMWLRLYEKDEDMVSQALDELLAKKAAQEKQNY